MENSSRDRRLDMLGKWTHKWGDVKFKTGPNGFHTDILIVWEPNFLGRMFACKQKSATYRGMCTVFHNLEDGSRADTDLESWLANILWKYENQE